MSDFLKKLVPSASMVITKQANQMIAEGKEVFVLSMGDAHFSPPTKVNEDLKKAIESGKTHYTASQGIPELRNSISHYYKGKYQPDEVLVTSGVKQGMYNYLAATPAQRIAVLEPAWLGYKALIVMAEKTYIAVNTHEENWISSLSKTRFDALFICTPNNPDGKVFSGSAVKELIEICLSKGAQLVIDEIYRDFIFDTDDHWPEGQYGNNGVIIFNGFSKSHAVTGLRAGYMLTKDQQLLKDCNNIQQNLATCASSLAQYGLVNFEASSGEVREFANYYRQNRDLVLELLPELKPFSPQGGFYFFIDIRVWGESDCIEFCRRLLSQNHVALVPGNAYGDGFESWVRLSFSLDRSKLKSGLLALKNFVYGS